MDSEPVLSTEATNATGTPEAAPSAFVQSIKHPSLLGLLFFSTTVAAVSLFDIREERVSDDDQILPMLIFIGASSQIVFGLIEALFGKTFGALLFSCNGGFTLSYALVYVPFTGILAAHANAETHELDKDLDMTVYGLILGWTMAVAIAAAIAALGRSGWNLVMSLGLFAVHLFLLAMGHVAPDWHGLVTAGGVFGLIGAGFGFCSLAVKGWARVRRVSGRNEPIEMTRFG